MCVHNIIIIICQFYIFICLNLFIDLLTFLLANNFVKLILDISLINFSFIFVLVPVGSLLQLQMR
jgi:hypothetical protein